MHKKKKSFSSIQIIWKMELGLQSVTIHISSQTSSGISGTLISEKSLKLLTTISEHKKCLKPVTCIKTTMDSLEMKLSMVINQLFYHRLDSVTPRIVLQLSRLEKVQPLHHSHNLRMPASLKQAGSRKFQAHQST